MCDTSANRLVAFGSFAYQCGDIMRSETDASRLFHWPLIWTKPIKVISSRKEESLCVDERERITSAGTPRATCCDFDGRLSAVNRGRHVLLFARSNLNAFGDFPNSTWGVPQGMPGAGGRHIQVAISRDGGRRFEPFKQLRFANYTLKAANNIYFPTVRAHAGGLLAAFPAVIEGTGGVFVAFSADRSGECWSAPVLGMRSEVLGDHTRDYPVDGDDGELGLPPFVEHGLLVQRDVRLRRPDMPPGNHQSHTNFTFDVLSLGLIHREIETLHQWA